MRLVLAVSLDGRLAPAEGGAAQLGGPGDRRRLEEALCWADAVVLGAQTLRLHGTSCLIHAPDLLQQRHQKGFPPQPKVIVWSRGGEISPELPFFRQPLERWLLRAAPGDLSPDAEVPGFSRILPFHTWTETLEQLVGLQRVVALGGAQLVASLMAAAVVDEIQLTLCPTLLGGSHLWLPAQATGDGSVRWALLEHRALAGGELLLHYERQEGL